jgi:hypothetical protein
VIMNDDRVFDAPRRMYLVRSEEVSLKSTQ